MSHETIGARLKRLRLERDLSQRELACPGVSYAYISRIEAGTRQPSVKALRRLADRLGISATYLETGSEAIEVAILVSDVDAQAARWGAELTWATLTPMSGSRSPRACSARSPTGSAPPSTRPASTDNSRRTRARR